MAIAERKLVARRERIQSLETLLAEAQKKLNVQNAKFEEQLRAYTFLFVKFLTYLMQQSNF